MCRWFAYISPREPCLLSDVLIYPANSITKQCSEHYLPKLLPHGDEHELRDSPDQLMKMRNSLLNMDGLGIAWYTDSASSYAKDTDGLCAALYKSQSPPINDFNFNSICSNTETRCVFAHIRATSGSPVNQSNSHPFLFGSAHAFMHNGVVSDFPAIRRDLLDLMSFDNFCNVHGSTDSEHIAALYMTHLGGGIQHATKETWHRNHSTSEMREAMIRTLLDVMRLQRRRLESKAKPNSLNLCATDGLKMVAVRFRNHETEQPPSLYWSEFAGRTLNRKYPGHPDSADLTNETATRKLEEHGRHTIIASEPTTFDQKEWHLITKNCSLTVDELGNEIEEAIRYDPGLNAIDPQT